MNDNVLRYVKRVFNVITILGFVATIVGGVYLWRLGAFQNQATIDCRPPFFGAADFPLYASFTSKRPNHTGWNHNGCRCHDFRARLGIYL